jgi:hypothetical protein
MLNTPIVVEEDTWKLWAERHNKPADEEPKYRSWTNVKSTISAEGDDRGI